MYMYLFGGLTYMGHTWSELISERSTRDDLPASDLRTETFEPPGARYAPQRDARQRIVRKEERRSADPRAVAL